MFNSNSNRVLVEGAIMYSLPHPIGERKVKLTAPDVDLHPDLISSQPKHIKYSWTNDGDGVGLVAPVTYQVAVVGPTRTARTRLMSDCLTILRNGDLLTGDGMARYTLAAVHQVGIHYVCRYDHIAQGHATGVQAYVPGKIVYALWEVIWDADSHLYDHFEAMSDGVALDPAQQTAVFCSTESGVVFRRRYPHYKTGVQSVSPLPYGDCDETAVSHPFYLFPAKQHVCLEEVYGR